MFCYILRKFKSQCPTSDYKILWFATYLTHFNLLRMCVYYMSVTLCNPKWNSQIFLFLCRITHPFPMTLNVTFITLNNDTSWARPEVFFLIYLPSWHFHIVLSQILFCSLVGVCSPATCPADSSQHGPQQHRRVRFLWKLQHSHLLEEHCMRVCVRGEYCIRVTISNGKVQWR